MKEAILFTGGSGKVGGVYLEHVVQKGIPVVTTTRNKQKFDIAHSDWKGKVQVAEVDFNEEGAAQKLINYLVENKIDIHTVVHNARNIDYLKIESDGTTSANNFSKELYLDVVFPYILTMELAVYAKLRNVIFISSIYGVVAPTPSLYKNFEQSSPINYGVSKAAQIHLVKELAVRLAPKGIRVNALSLGGIEGRVDPEFKKRYSELNPMSKMLLEKDIIAPLDFLISDSSANMTGHNLIVDGGWTVW